MIASGGQETLFPLLKFPRGIVLHTDCSVEKTLCVVFDIKKALPLWLYKMFSDGEALEVQQKVDFLQL